MIQCSGHHNWEQSLSVKRNHCKIPSKSKVLQKSKVPKTKLILYLKNQKSKDCNYHAFRGTIYIQPSQTGFEQKGLVLCFFYIISQKCVSLKNV